jgi:hypothetical protein
MRRALPVISVLVWAACGSPPSGPTPSPTPPVPGGPVEGRYLLKVTPAPGCAMAPNPLSFPMNAAPSGTMPHSGVQILVNGDGSRFELELLSTGTALRGGLGTTEEGVMTEEGLRAWVRAIGSGPVFHAADGRGEVLAGTLSGDLALGEADGEEGELGTCSSTDHSFTMRAQ